jgi:hypothetical protein
MPVPVQPSRRRNGFCNGMRVASAFSHSAVLDPKTLFLPADTRLPWILTTCALLLMALACSA